MTTINRAALSKLLEPGLSRVFGSYKNYPAQWKKIYDTSSSKKANETDVEMKYLGAADIKEEGAPIASGTMGQRIATTYVHKTVGLSFSITQEAIDDDLYAEQFPMQTRSLFRALDIAKNLLSANILNNAFSSSHPIGDGQPVCSTQHPVDGGVYSNRLQTPSDLTEAALEQANIDIQAFVDQSNQLVVAKGVCLVVPSEREFDAIRILKSEFRTDTANNDINAMYNAGFIPKGYTVNNYLTDPKAWFVKTDIEQGLRHFQRKEAKTSTYVDFNTDTFMAKAVERYSFGVSDARGIFGSQGT
jgi:phage major head subunit gpT-like protein